MQNDVAEGAGGAGETALVGADTVGAGGRWRLVRDVAMFQVKLVADGLRDLVLSPLSIVAGVLGLVFGGSRPDVLFQDVLAIGRRTERWIDLFGAQRVENGGTAEPGIDAIADRIEDLIRSDLANGGVTAKTRRTVDDLLSRLAGHRRGRRRRRGGYRD
jgi:hypothetical protein